MSSSSTPSFARLVAALKSKQKTCSVVEQCCGGLISSSILAQPGASQVYVGGSVVYNTRKSKPLLLNDNRLYSSISQYKSPNLSETEAYVRSKLHWTGETSAAFCEQVGTDYAIAEGGAAGPTFRPKDLTKGFAVIAVAGRQTRGSGAITVLQQRTIWSRHANRQRNMRNFADAAADLLTEVINGETISQKQETQQSDPPLPIDRSAHLRSDSDALERLQQQTGTRYLLLCDGKRVLAQNPQEPTYLSISQLHTMTEGVADYETTFLGIQSDGEALFSVHLPDGAVESADFVDTRTSAPLFQPDDNAHVLYATALAQWQQRTRFCSLCGGAMVIVQAGTCATCSQCKTDSWPRQDPSMIAVICSPDGQRVLLGRSPRHPPKVYSTLAGFVEAGETLEAAVAREAWEEVGVRVDNIRYVGSQPWPFPQSSMVGFSATADDAVPLNIDKNELESAAWFDRADIAKAANATLGLTSMKPETAREILECTPDLKLLIPPKGVIARRLLDDWLDGKVV